MSFNENNYNTGFSGRNNTTDQFVSGTEMFLQGIRKHMSQEEPPMQPPPEVPKGEEDNEMAPEVNAATLELNDEIGETARPHSKKNKPCTRVKKMAKRERRWQQNEYLRQTLTPKNAQSLLNEMMPNEQVSRQFKVEPATTFQYKAFKASKPPTYCADLAMDGNVYKGYGDNKLMARNDAAEQAVRDLLIKKMNKAINSNSGTISGGEAVEEEALPMLQLASYGLHKLFKQWEFEGHEVPQLKPNYIIVPPPAFHRALPDNASAMHPTMLLTYMRPTVEFRELDAEGDQPQTYFTVSVEVDGAIYTGRAPNKKEARKAAATAACWALFQVIFETNDCADAPVFN